MRLLLAWALEFSGVLADAARLLNSPPSTVKRWLDGYSFRVTSGTRHRSKALVQHNRAERELSFLDLAELLVVRALRQELGLSMKAVRNAAEYLTEHHPELRHPLASEYVETDGKEVFLRLSRKEAGGDEILNVSRRGQSAMAAVISRYLHQLDFNRDSRLAERWWPLGKQKPIVIDPRVAFGSPHVAGTGIQTRTLWGQVKAGDSPNAIAEWFDLKEALVQAAVSYENGLRRKVA